MNSNSNLDHYTDQLVEAWLDGKWGEVVRDIRGRGREGRPDTERSAALAVAVFEKLNRRLGQGNVQACEFYQRVTSYPSHTQENAWAEVDPPLATCGLKTKAECKACETHLGSGQCEYLDPYQDEPDEPDEPEAEKTWHRVEGYTNQDGSVNIHVATNDNLDKGWPSEHAEWDSSCRNVLAFLEQHGTSRVGCMGCQVTVKLNGREVKRFETTCPNCGAEALHATVKDHATDGHVCVDYECGARLLQARPANEYVWPVACPKPLKAGC